MRIGINLQMLRPGGIGGMEVYVRNLIARMPQLDKTITLVLFCADYNIDTFSPQPRVEKVLLTDLEFSQLNAEKLSTYRLDGWFCPLLVVEPHEPGLPSVVTIPDMQHTVYPEYLPAEVLAWRHEHYGRSAKTAQRVLTLSRHAKKSIVECLEVEADKVVAIHLGADEVFSEKQSVADAERCRSSYPVEQPYFYFPANNWPHKNHRALFQAMALLRQQRGDCPNLLLTGSDVNSVEAERSELERLGIEDKVFFLGYVPRQDMPQLYRHALALVFPSQFEGFGIPLVEAMCCECPVISSSATSLPEVGGDAVAYVHPDNPQELADQMDAFWHDENLRRSFAKKGKKHSREFSWDRTARQTLEVLQEVFPSQSTCVDGKRTLVGRLVDMVRRVA